MDDKRRDARMSYASSIPISSMHQSVDQQPEHRIAPELNISVVVIISLLVAAFALSGCLHLVARWCFGHRQNTDAESAVNLGSMRGPLQHVDDTGVDQASIDTFPVFLYKYLNGVEESNDCAVCLSEFQPDDRLRLLPHCSHAFHIDCIGIWLYSHSTCPLCRQSVLSDVFANSRLFVMIGDSYRSSPDIVLEGEERIERSDPRISRGSDDGLNVYASPRSSPTQIYSHKRARSEKVVSKDIDNRTMFVHVQLGRFKTASAGETSTRQRSYSMGSSEYVLNASDLRVPLSPLSYSGMFSKRHYHRSALSECMQEFKHEEFRRTAEIDRAALKRKQMSIELDSTVIGGSSGRNFTTDDKVEVKFEASPSPPSVKERLLSRMWPLSAPKSPASVPSSSTRGRTISFRLARPERKIKVSQKRRSLSETTVLDSVVIAAHGSGNEGECSSGRLPSFRKWALNWLRI